MNNPILITITFLLCLSFGCGYSTLTDTVITGTIYDPTSELGWPGVKVAAFNIGDLAVVDKTFTDDQGNYELRYRGQTEDPVGIGVDLDDVYAVAGYAVTSCDDLLFVNVDHEEVQEINFPVYSMGFLRLSVINDNCQGSQDQMDLTWRSTWASCMDLNFTVNVSGCRSFNAAKDSTIVFPAGMQVFEWTVTKNDTTETFVDSVVMNTGAILDFDLAY